MIRVKNSGIMSRVGQVVGMGKSRGACIQDFCGKTRSERDNLEDLSVCGRIILKWNGLIRLRVGTSGGLLGHRNKSSVSIKGGNFLTRRGTIYSQERLCCKELVTELVT